MNRNKFFSQKWHLPVVEHNQFWIVEITPVEHPNSRQPGCFFLTCRCRRLRQNPSRCRLVSTVWLSTTARNLSLNIFLLKRWVFLNICLGWVGPVIPHYPLIPYVHLCIEYIDLILTVAHLWVKNKFASAFVGSRLVITVAASYFLQKETQDLKNLKYKTDNV